MAFISPRNKEAKWASVWSCANCDKCFRAKTRVLWHSQQSPRMACGLRPDGGEWAEEGIVKNKQTKWKQQQVSKVWGPAGPNQAAVLGSARKLRRRLGGSLSVFQKDGKPLRDFSKEVAWLIYSFWRLFLIVVVVSWICTHTFTHTHTHKGGGKSAEINSVGCIIVNFLVWYCLIVM